MTSKQPLQKTSESSLFPFVHDHLFILLRLHKSTARSDINPFECHGKWHQTGSHYTKTRNNFISQSFHQIEFSGPCIDDLHYLCVQQLGYTLHKENSWKNRKAPWTWVCVCQATFRVSVYFESKARCFEMMYGIILEKMILQKNKNTRKW